MDIGSTFTLKNGYKIPVLGYGLWKTPDSDVAVKGILSAIENGYRHIDGAAIYGNEKSEGKALAASPVPRAQLFVTSKLWNTYRGYDSALKAFDQTLADLGTDYLDLYLIHWPDHEDLAKNRETWKAFERLYEEKRVRAIGLSNFTVPFLKDIMASANIQPMVVQIENHPGYVQQDTIDLCQKNGIIVEAWSPLGNGVLVKEKSLQEMASRYGKDVGQLCLRFCLQQGIVPLSKSVKPARIASNAKIFDFTISDADMEKLLHLPRLGFSGNDPATFSPPF